MLADLNSSRPRQSLPEGGKENAGHVAVVNVAGDGRLQRLRSCARALTLYSRTLPEHPGEVDFNAIADKGDTGRMQSGPGPDLQGIFATTWTWCCPESTAVSI